MTTTLPPLNLRDLGEIVRPLAPVATLYLGPGHDAEDRALRLRAVAARLVDLGAPPPTVETVCDRVETTVVPTTGVAIGVAGQVVLFHQPIPGWSRADRCRYGTPGHVAPLLSWLQRHPPYVEVLIDRAGAEVISMPAGTRSATVRHVAGPDDEIERNAPGGWAQPRYQRRAEDSWRHNAGAVADAAGAALRKLDAGLLLVGGDVRAVQLFEDRIRGRMPTVIVRRVPGGRHPDGSAPARELVVGQHVAEYADERNAAVLAAVHAELGPNGRGVVGVTNTLTALAAGRIRTLLVTDDEADDRIAWFGPDTLCVDESARPGLPAGQPLRPGRLVDVAVRAALLTHADVRVLDDPGGLAEGIGGLGRFPA